MFGDLRFIHLRADLERLSEYAHAADRSFCRLQQRRRSAEAQMQSDSIIAGRICVRRMDSACWHCFCFFTIGRRPIDRLEFKVTVVCLRDGRLYASNQDDPLCQ
jgi:hypothetical protein